jgi:UDP-N-acetyl-alpha-D-muramoyl-L-alanyl-L-glutamate epimerase
MKDPCSIEQEQVGDGMSPLPNNPHLHATIGEPEPFDRLCGLDCFHYDDYAWERSHSNLRLLTRFRMGSRESFQTQSTFFLPASMDAAWSEQGEAEGFALGMVEGISYWKAACPGRWEVHCGQINVDQESWWHRLLWHGLGEFRHCNNLHATTQGKLCEVVSKGRQPVAACVSRVGDAGRILVPVGGGKDSLLSLQLLKRWGYEVIPFAINPGRATLRMLESLGLLARLVRVERKIDSRLIGLNKAGFFNGHTPFSAVIGFHAHVAAQALGCGGIALSNEASADESTVGDVNHQYSKTTGFESDFREYQEHWLGMRPATYFSLLRPLNEVQIAGLLTRQQADPGLAVSCNRHLEEGAWCGACSKCLASALVLLPFLGNEWLAASFKTNPLAQPGGWDTLLGLLGATPEKPFDCVPSRKDIRVALSIMSARHPERLQRHPLLERWQSSGSPGLETWEVVRSHAQAWNHSHFLPDGMESLLQKELTAWVQVEYGMSNHASEAQNP